METVTISRAEYERLNTQVAALEQEINRLTELIRLARKQRFGASSEKSQSEDGFVQLSYLFNEPECMTRENAPEPDVEEIAIRAHARKARRATQEKLPEDIEVEVIDKTLTEDERVCPQCRGQMNDIGKDVSRRLKIIPARFVVEEQHMHKYACKHCQEHEMTTPIKVAAAEPAVIKGSIATPEAIAHIMTQKYVMYSPLYRQEQEYLRAGVPLSRQTMSNWLLKAASLWFKPVYDRMKAELLKQDILHADETTLQVLHEPGKKAQSKSYIWLYRTGRDAPGQIVLYEYQESRRAEHPETFLKDYRGYLHADGYAVYYGLPGGIEGILPLERMAGVDVNRIREKYPELIMVGGFDKTQMRHGEAAMRREFERLLPAIRSGRYIPSVDHQTPPDVTIENYGVFMRLLREFAAEAGR